MKKIFSVVMILLILLNMSIVFAEEYYVQVGAFESEAKAIKYTKYLNDIGYTAVMIPVYDLHKVFLGPYETEEEARADLSRYKDSGGDAFFVIGSQMYYQRPKVEETVEVEDEGESIDDTSTEQQDETAEATEDLEVDSSDVTVEEEVNLPEETVEEEVESSDETEDEASVDEDISESEVESVDVNETIVTRVVEQPEVETPRYKIFTIMLIVVLWVLFIAVVVVVRLKQSKNG